MPWAEIHIRLFEGSGQLLLVGRQLEAKEAQFPGAGESGRDGD